MGIFGDLIACTTIFGAFVKRQEEGAVTHEFGGHINVILADGKMHQRPALEGQQRFGLIGSGIFRQAGFFILRNGVLHRLFEFGFQLQRGNWQAVDKQHQVDAPFFGFHARFCKDAI